VLFSNRCIVFLLPKCWHLLNQKQSLRWWWWEIIYSLTGGRLSIIIYIVNPTLMLSIRMSEVCQNYLCLEQQNEYIFSFKNLQLFRLRHASDILWYRDETLSHKFTQLCGVALCDCRWYYVSVRGWSHSSLPEPAVTKLHNASETKASYSIPLWRTARYVLRVCSAIDLYLEMWMLSTGFQQALIARSVFPVQFLARSRETRYLRIAYVAERKHFLKGSCARLFRCKTMYTVCVLYQAHCYKA